MKHIIHSYNEERLERGKAAMPCGCDQAHATGLFHSFSNHAFGIRNDQTSLLRGLAWPPATQTLRQ